MSRVHIADPSPTPVHAVKVGDRLRERRSGEVRQVVALGGTITDRILDFDDGTHIECGVLDTVFVTSTDLTPTKGQDRD